MSQSVHNIQKAYALFQKGDNAGAEAVICQAFANDQNSYELLRIGALTALNLNQVSIAHDRIQQAIQIKGLDAEVSNTLGNILKAAGEWTLSEQAYRNSLKLNPKNPMVRANLVDMLVQSGQPKEVLSELKQSGSDFQATPLSKLAKATSLINTLQFPDALDVLKSVDDRKYAGKREFLKARACFHLDEFEKMREVWRETDPTSSLAGEVFSIVSNADTMLGQTSVLIDEILDIHKNEGAHISLLQKTFNALRRLDQSKLLESQLKMVVAGRGHLPELLVEMSKLSAEKGDYIGALDYAEKAHIQRTNSLPLILHLAQCCLVTEKYSKADELIKQALIQAPNNQFVIALHATSLKLQKMDHFLLHNYEKFVRVYDFDCPPEFSSIEQFNQVLEKELDKLYRFQKAPNNQSVRGGVQTDIDLAMLDIPVFETFFKMASDCISDYSKTIGNSMQNPLTRRNTGGFRFNGAWSVKLTENGNHVNHVHPQGWVSSCYYVKTPNAVEEQTLKQGWIKFGEPGIQGLSLKAEKFVKPKPGRLVLFPSYLWHGTEPFSGNDVRITLPFDVLPQ